MAVVLDTDYGSKHYGTFYLEICNPEDAARIRAGEEWLEAENLAYLERTRDWYETEFCNAERPWRAEFLPRKLLLTEGTELPDHVHSYPGGNNRYAHSCLVSPRLRDLIETHETAEDGWQFFPVEILNKDGTPYGTYYAWRVHKVVDGIDASSEGVTSVAGPADGRHSWTYSGERGPEYLKVRKSVIGGLTAWIDFRFQPFAHIFISDALYNAMKDAEMTCFRANSVWSEV